MAAVGQTLEERRRELQDAKARLAAIPPDSPPSPTDSAALRAKRAKRGHLEETLRRIEEQLDLEEKAEHEPIELKRAFRDYYDRARRKIERSATDPRCGTPVRGNAFVEFTVGSNGRVENVVALRASSPEFENFALAVVRCAAPFGVFSEVMRAKYQRLVVRNTLSYDVK